MPWGIGAMGLPDIFGLFCKVLEIHLLFERRSTGQSIFSKMSGQWALQLTATVFRDSLSSGACSGEYLAFRDLPKPVPGRWLMPSAVPIVNEVETVYGFLTILM
ncbi:MAG: hypothetical protein NTNFB01_22460 [Nitrospira sp.]|jgi:hypothetical protein